MTPRWPLRTLALWNECWFVRFNLILALVGLVYLLFFTSAARRTHFPPPTSQP